jgi:two-component system, chemotaxis family, chemotaxis protein CheY
MAETLLLADANPTMQRVVELTCAEQGLKVVSVSDGQQALDYLVAERPALALVSVTLHKLDGFEIAGLVRDRLDLQGIPVLLLAGAFETIDETRVRESGAAGVLVKPFEPGLVIKRVKELLGISKSDGGSSSVPSAESQSGRLVTSADGLMRGSDTAVVEASESGEDYFGKLEEAFEPLDAEQASRAEPGGAPNSLPTPEIPAAMDPERRPSPPPLAATSLHDQLAAWPETSRPVSAVDEDWFGKNNASSVTREELTGAAASGRTAADGQAGQSAPGASIVPEPEAAVGAIDWRALQDEMPAPIIYGTPSESGRNEALEETAVTEDFAPPMTSPPTRGRSLATYAEMTAPAAVFPAADAFAMLWAHEQGEPLPPVPPPPPVELSEQTVDAVAQRMTDQLSDRVINDLSSRVTDGLARRVTEDLARRISNDLSDQLGETFVARLTDGIASRLTAAVSDRLGEPLTTDLASRVSSGLAEQIAAQVAERMMQHAFGDSLRQTVHDVSERLVREEIARIRAAAESSTRS